jgi:hypothetical protein
MQRLFTEPLFYIYLVYSISFFTVAYLVAKGAAGGRSVPLVAAFNMLALFGLIHGITELTDWVRFIRKSIGAPELDGLTWLSQVSLIVSFVVLLQFAINLLSAQSTGKVVPAVRLFPIAALIAFVAFVFVRQMSDVLAIGLLGRHAFGPASALLAAIAILRTAGILSLLGDRSLVRSLYLAAAAFVCYAVVGGVIVIPIGGVPIQMFRSVCAVAIAVSAFALLKLSTTVAANPSELQVANA